MSNLPDNLERVAALFDHPAFIRTNPNCNYSVFRGLAMSPVNFHAEDGSGYALFAQKLIELDKINGQVAGRIVTAFSKWRKVDSHRQSLMKKQLQQLLDTPGLSENSKEVVSKTLA